MPGGRLSELRERYGAGDVKGELVVVVAPPERSEASEAIDVAGLAARLLADGMKPSRAARELAKIAGIPSDEAYEVVRSAPRMIEQDSQQ